MHISNAIRNKEGNEFAVVHTFQESIKINIKNSFFSLCIIVCNYSWSEKCGPTGSKTQN